MSQRRDHHEFAASHQEIETSSDRSFGLVFAVVFALLAGYFAWRGHGWWPALLAPATAFLLLALMRPALLAWPNRLWTRLGLLIGAVAAPVSSERISCACAAIPQPPPTGCRARTSSPPPSASATSFDRVGEVNPCYDRTQTPGCG
jgi:hypothetical protein